jgi:ArsR family transcriptional regulator
MQDLIQAAKALSDPTRVRILNLLLERECCVCEVMQALQISQTRASRNLSALHRAGFLTLEKNGLWSLYSINQDKASGYLSFLLKAVEAGLKHDTLPAEDKERLKKAVRVGPGCARPRN